MNEDLRRLDIHRALSRPNLIMGADRELVLGTGLLTAILMFVVLTPLAALLGLVTWTAVVAGLRAMARNDPLMRQVYLRHIRYRARYHALGTPWSKGARQW